MNATEIERIAMMAKNDRKAMDTLVRELSDLAASVTSYYVRNTKGGENHREDILSNARIGIMDAVESFDFTRTGFIPYAKVAMETSVRKYLSECLRTIRLPKHVLTDMTKIRRAEEHFAAMGVTPTRAELKAESGIASEKTFRNVLWAKPLEDTYSLDYVMNDDEDEGYTLGSTIADSETTEKDVFGNELQDQLKEDVMALPEKERYVILHSYGLYGREKFPNESMARELDVTIASVINYRNRGLAKLRTSLADWTV